MISEKSSDTALNIKSLLANLQSLDIIFSRIMAIESGANTSEVPEKLES